MAITSEKKIGRTEISVNRLRKEQNVRLSFSNEIKHPAWWSTKISLVVRWTNQHLPWLL